MADSIEFNSVECNSIETSNLNNQQFRLNEIKEINDYFIAEIRERELMSKELTKYIASFDYFDKSLMQQVLAFLLHHLQQLLEHL